LKEGDPTLAKIEVIYSFNVINKITKTTHLTRTLVFWSFYSRIIWRFYRPRTDNSHLNSFLEEL